MNSQEREVISDIFRRLEQAAGQPRDPEAERFIADKIRQQPYAPYAMAQLIYVQEEAIKSLNQQLEELRAGAERGKEREGGFLSSIFGGPRPQPEPVNRAPGGSPWGGPPASYGQPGPYAAQQPGPWGGQPAQMGGMQPQGGGFLRSALTTAAGVAGGMVVGNALMNAFGGGQHQALGGFSNSDLASLGGGNTGERNFADLSPFGGGQADAGLQDAAYQPEDDLGGDFGGDDGDDWA